MSGCAQAEDAASRARSPSEAAAESRCGAQICCTRTMAAAAFTVLEGQSQSSEEMQSTATFRMLKAFFAVRPFVTLPPASCSAEPGSKRACSLMHQDCSVSMEGTAMCMREPLHAGQLGSTIFFPHDVSLHEMT